MTLRRRHPDVAYRSCDDCRRWMYKPNGQREQLIDVADGREVEIDKPRPAGSPVPCDTAAGCPKGHYTNPKGFCERSSAAYQHHCECRAVGSFPSDGLVRRHAAIIDGAERDLDRLEAQDNALIAAGIDPREARK